MKKTRWMVGALLIAGMAQAEVVTLDESTPTKVANWIAREAGTVGTPTGVATAGVGSNTGLDTVAAGIVTGAWGGLYRNGFDFDVSGQQTITNAMLSVYLGWKVSPTVDLAVFAKTVGGTLNATSTKAIKAYNDSGYVDTGLRMVPGSAFGFHAFDVTSYVTNAVANGGTVSFRFQMLNDTSLPFGTDNRYALRSFRTTSQEPSLDLYIIP